MQPLVLVGHIQNVQDFLGRHAAHRRVEHRAGEGVARAGGVDHVGHRAELPPEAAARRGVGTGECLMAGDRLATDIALGVNAGALTCHILAPGADLVVPEGIRPDYQVNNLGELKRIWEHV